jgi:hypothetical protein
MFNRSVWLGRVVGGGLVGLAVGMIGGAFVLLVEIEKDLDELHVGVVRTCGPLR